MIILKTTDLLRFRLTAASTNPLPFTSYYAGIGSAYTPTNTNGVSSGINDVTLCPVDATYQRQIKGISIYNADTATAEVNVELYDGANARLIIKITLQVGDTLHYSDVDMWFVTDANGFRKVSTNIVSLYTALTTNSYITWTYSQSAGTIVGVPINDTTTQKIIVKSNNNTVGTRSTIDFQNTDDFQYKIYDDSVNNKILLQSYDARNLIMLLRKLLLELDTQGFVFNDEDLLNELGQYDGYTNMNAQRRK